MKIPNYIKQVIERRANHAAHFSNLDSSVVDWMKKNGIDVCDARFSDHILTGAESLFNPYSSADTLVQLIEEYEPPKEET